MRISLKLFASLAKCLPSGAKGNQVELEVADDESPAQVLERLRVPLDQAHLWLLNGVYIEPEDRHTPGRDYRNIEKIPTVNRPFSIIQLT